MTPERMRELTAFCRRRRAADGITHIPNIDLVFLEESAFDAWDEAGRPETFTAPVPLRPQARAPTRTEESRHTLSRLQAIARGDA
jgi:hypothetical protein